MGSPIPTAGVELDAVPELPTPSLVLDLEILDRNLETMDRRTRELGVRLRPHVKTHKCLEIAERQRRRGARGITVATLEEARLFARHGHADLTWAFPVVLGRLAEAREIAESTTLRLVVDSEAAVAALERLGHPFHVWLKVDCGYHRAGVDPSSAEATDLARRLAGSRVLRFDGLLTHSGQAYRVRGREALAAVAEDERRVMVELAERLRAEGIEVEVSVGSTPAMSAARHLDGVDEARPGNYAFHDFMQTEIGSCAVGDCAVTVVASVVSSSSDHAVIDAGALALSKDTGIADRGHGRLFADYRASQLAPGVEVVSVSQEHGIVNVPLPVGARVRVLPNHSCLTVACFDAYTVLSDGAVVDRWTIHRQR